MFVQQDKVRVNSDFVWTRKCSNGDIEIDKDSTRRFKINGLYVPDKFGDNTNWAIIMGVGPKCKHFGKEHIGLAVQLPEMVTGHYQAPAIGFSEDDESVKDRQDFFTRESILMKLFPATMDYS